MSINIKIPVAMEDFTLNENLFEKYIPQKQREKVLNLLLNDIKCGSDPATRHLTTIYQPEHVIKNIPKILLKMRDIYELNLIGVQYLLNLIDKYNYNPKDVNVLIWGCGNCVVDYYLNKLGYNVTSHDNWSQLPKTTTLKVIDLLDNTFEFKNSIKIEDNVKELEKNDFDIILDTGNYLTNQKIVMNKNLKILFTWEINRLDKAGHWGGHSNNNSENLDYLKQNIKFIYLPSSKVFVRNDLL